MADQQALMIACLCCSQHRDKRQGLLWSASYRGAEDLNSCPHASGAVLYQLDHLRRPASPQHWQPKVSVNTAGYVLGWRSPPYPRTQPKGSTELLLCGSGLFIVCSQNSKSSSKSPLRKHSWERLPHQFSHSFLLALTVQAPASLLLSHNSMGPGRLITHSACDTIAGDLIRSSMVVPPQRKVKI